MYLMLKNFNDKHNLYFVYGPSHMVSQGGIKIHSTAVTMTKFSVVLLLIAFTGISYLRDGNEIRLRTSVLVFSLISSLFLFSSMSCIKKCTSQPRTIIEDATQPPPGKCLKSLLRSTILSTNQSNLSRYQQKHSLHCWRFHEHANQWKFAQPHQLRLGRNNARSYGVAEQLLRDEWTCESLKRLF